jgi:acetylcholinesterase
LGGFWLVGVFCTYTDFPTGASISFGPVFDNKIRHQNNTDQALLGAFTKLPAIIGTNQSQGVASVALGNAYLYNTMNQTVADLHTKAFFLCPAAATMKNRFTQGPQTFRYYYQGNFSNISPRDRLS